MPNWCINELEIKGKPKEVSKLMKQVEITNSESNENHYAQVFSCHKVIPRPISQESNWYDWNVTNWGSKWDTNDSQRYDKEWEEGVVKYQFDTAWSPIVQVIEELAKQYPKLLLTYTYYESGSDFWGEHEYKKGKETSYEGGSLSDAGCERLEYLMGDHHVCQECWGEIPCYGTNGTPEFCEECLEKQLTEEKELWERSQGECETEQALKTA